MKTKTQKTFLDKGFGFPVRLHNVQMVQVRGVWTPNINYHDLARAVLLALSRKASRLTGREVRFIRTHFEMTLQAFARRFCVSHVAVLKWERAGDKPTMTGWTTEKDLRLFVLSRLGASAKDLARLYKDLEIQPSAKLALIQLNAHDVAA
jgi:transcriptional regulator with XRE-family HTH domain